eukprot:SAG22_NODE_8753_length_632_cov_1.285178_1_plen_59_part_10
MDTEEIPDTGGDNSPNVEENVEDVVETKCKIKKMDDENFWVYTAKGGPLTAIPVRARFR